MANNDDSSFFFLDVCYLFDLNMKVRKYMRYVHRRFSLV